MKTNEIEFWETVTGLKATIVAKNIENANIWLGYVDTGNSYIPRTWNGKTLECTAFKSDNLKCQWIDIPWHLLPQQAKYVYQLRNGGWRWSSHIPYARPMVREPNEITYDFLSANNIWWGNIPDGIINWKGDYRKSLQIKDKFNSQLYKMLFTKENKNGH